MKIKVTTIDFEIPRRTKRLALLVGVPTAALLGAAALAYAGVPNTFSSGEPLSSSQMNANFSSLDARVTTLETAPGVPSGTIVAFGGGTAPTGWLPCDGSQLDGTNATYAALYAAIGTGFGGNSTSKAFNLPDLRGRFLRGWDDTSGNDPDAASRTPSQAGGNAGAKVGSLQGDQLASHTHGVNDPGHAHSINEFLAFSGPAINGGYTAGGQPFLGGNGTAAATTGITLAASGGSETRPRNVAVSYIIKL
jgi:microcystin-dependent protein